MDIQLELFPASAVTGTGRPRPWWGSIAADQADASTDTQPTQDDELPLGYSEDAA